MFRCPQLPQPHHAHTHPCHAHTPTVHTPLCTHTLYTYTHHAHTPHCAHPFHYAYTPPHTMCTHPTVHSPTVHTLPPCTQTPCSLLPCTHTPCTHTPSCTDTPTVHTPHNHKMKSRPFSLLHPNRPRPALGLPLPLSLIPGKGCEISAGTWLPPPRRRVYNSGQLSEEVGAKGLGERQTGLAHLCPAHPSTEHPRRSRELLRLRVLLGCWRGSLTLLSPSEPPGDGGCC